MKYDFDEIINRRGTDSLKWQVQSHELPLWVADMDFRVAPPILEAMKKRLDVGVFGYAVVPEEWFDAIIEWWKTRHGYAIDKDSLIFTTGIVPAISSLVKRFSNIGDNVLLQTPVYDIFFHSVENAGRHVLENKLVYDGEKYSVDFTDLEEKLALSTTTLMILCNPHNPVGRTFSADELVRIGELCKKHGVTVISDEIHCDLTAPNVSYTPFAAVSKICEDVSVTCISASKAFNIAGLQSAAVFAKNPVLKAKAERGLNSDDIAEPNVFACDTAIAAFKKCGEWNDQLREYIEGNRKYARETLKGVNSVKMLEQNASYLLWIDTSELTHDSAALCDFLRKETGLYICDGARYRGNGNDFVRINIAYPRAVLADALERFKRGIALFAAKNGKA